MSDIIKKGSSVLRPRARLIQTIGEELISSDVVAVIELVKNSYDADASIITITFDGTIEDVEVEPKKFKKLLKKEGASITITDDGCGMSLDVIHAAWMEPATLMKKGEKRSPEKKRRYTGEKGIGRFASAKLSKNLEIITKAESEDEIVVNFKWEDFSKEEKYLDQIETNWIVRKPKQFKSHGTTLILQDLNVDWDQEKFRELKIALSRLINPVAPIEDFLIELDVPEEFSNFSGLISAPEAINRPDYVIKGSVDASGIASYSYKSKKNGYEIKKDLGAFLIPKRKPVSGPFKFEFRVWDREAESLNVLAKEIGSTLKNVRADLDEISGVSIYRDNFRVLPYGDRKNDWLRLNYRRVNNPTLRISNNQVVGYISIGLDANKDLKDQSNREGIVDSPAFSDLQQEIQVILSDLESKRYEERPRKDDNDDEGENLYSNFSIGAVEDVVNKKLPNDLETKKVLAETKLKIEKGIQKVQEVLARYRRLSTLGLLIDAVLHDGSQHLLRIDGESRLLEKELKKKLPDQEEILKHLHQIQEQRKFLAQLFKRIEPFGGRKRGRPANIVLEDAIKNVFELSKGDLNRLGVEVSLPQGSHQVTIDEGELQTIIINLLQNSIYWLGTIDGKRKIAVEVEKKDEELSIFFSDSGPGIEEQKSKFIFDPYYTTRPDGVGLGLTIVGELVSEYGGEFLLMKEGALDGANFKIVFRRRI